jgi:hypothetical protein
MRTLLSILLIVALVLFQLDKELPRFYIFKPERLQELAKDSIARHPNNVTELLSDLTNALREEYGEQHVMPFTKAPEKWIWRSVKPHLVQLSVNT